MTYVSDYDKVMKMMASAKGTRDTQRFWNAIGKRQASLINKAIIILKQEGIKNKSLGSWKWLTKRAYGVAKRIGA